MVRQGHALGAVTDHHALLAGGRRGLVGAAVLVVEAVAGLGQARAHVVRVRVAIGVIIGIGTAVVVLEAVAVLGLGGAAIVVAAHPIAVVVAGRRRLDDGRRAALELEAASEIQAEEEQARGIGHRGRGVLDEQRVAHHRAHGERIDGEERPAHAHVDRPAHQVAGDGQEQIEIEEGPTQRGQRGAIDHHRAARARAQREEGARILVGHREPRAAARDPELEQGPEHLEAHAHRAAAPEIEAIAVGVGEHDAEIRLTAEGERQRLVGAGGLREEGHRQEQHERRETPHRVTDRV